jgi:hypothetical protein
MLCNIKFSVCMQNEKVHRIQNLVVLKSMDFVSSQFSVYMQTENLTALADIENRRNRVIK